MEFIHEIFNQALSLKRSNVPSTFTSEFNLLVGHELHDNYLVLTPSERNIEIVNGIKSVFPDATVYDEYDKDCRRRITFKNLLSKEVSGKNPSANTLIDSLKRMALIVEKTPEVSKYLDSLKVMYKLENKRYTPPRRLFTLTKQKILRGISNYLNKSNIIRENVVEMNFTLRDGIPKNYITFKYDYDVENFIWMSHKDQMVYRDKMVEKAFKDTQEFFQVDADMTKFSHSFYIQRNLYNSLSYSTRDKLSKVNGSSSYVSKKVKNDESKFLITVTHNSTFKDTREFIIRALEDRNNKYLEFFKNLINKS